MKRAITLLLALLLSVSMVLPAFAAQGTVRYEGNARSFVFAPGSDQSVTDLFPDFKDVMPGDMLTQQITVKNEASRNVNVRLYMRSLGAQAGSEDFLSQLRLQVKKSDDNAAPHMFDAAADQTAQLTDWVYLGTLYSGGEVNLDVTLTVPEDLSSDYQNKIGYLNWEFKAEEFPIYPGDPTPTPAPPSGGDTPDRPNTPAPTPGGSQTPGGTTPPSGGGSGSVDPEDPTPPSGVLTVPVSGDENTIHVRTYVDGTTAMIESIDQEELNYVIGHGVETGVITIDFSVLQELEWIDHIDTVVIPAEVIEMIAEAVSDPHNDAHSLEILFFDGISIEFDKQALINKVEQADGLDITISIKIATDVDLTGAQEKTIGDHIAFDVTVTSGGVPISNMGGLVTLHAPYELREGERGEDIVVLYVDPEGKTERCVTSYDEESERVNWKTDHLSVYMIEHDGCCWICLWIFLAVCAIILLVIIIYRRKRKK